MDNLKAVSWPEKLEEGTGQDQQSQQENMSRACKIMKERQSDIELVHKYKRDVIGI